MSADLVYYAIGDVHGEADRLQRMHEAILADIAALGAPARVIHLGDLIDRGPMSRQTVAAAKAFIEAHGEGPITAACLRGNHEQMMLESIATNDPRTKAHWLRNGGQVALHSYEVANGVHADWRQSIDEAHVAWIAALGLLEYVPERQLAFVHAGIEPASFPHCPEEVFLWTRSEHFFDRGRWPNRPITDLLCVVHGHTPTEGFQPYVGPHRINVDTGCVYGGALTAAVLAPGEKVRFLKA